MNQSRVMVNSSRIAASMPALSRRVAAMCASAGVENEATIFTFAGR